LFLVLLELSKRLLVEQAVQVAAQAAAAQLVAIARLLELDGTSKAATAALVDSAQEVAAAGLLALPSAAQYLRGITHAAPQSAATVARAALALSSLPTSRKEKKCATPS
jgi:hypothetical protein